jgi:hypothetical protein
VGTVTFLLTGLVLMFPFSNIAGSSYVEKMSSKLKGLTVLLKFLLLLTLTVLFALMTLLGTGFLTKMGDAGLLLVLTSVCSSLLPFAPLPGKAIYNYQKTISLALVVPLLVLIFVYELQLLPLYSYLLVGLIAAASTPLVVNQIRKQRNMEKTCAP